MQVVINGSNIHDIPSFYEEINRVFMRSETWTIANSLDAFNDLLYGGFGVISKDQQVDLIWINLDASRRSLGYDATRAYYIEKLGPESPYN